MIPGTIAKKLLEIFIVNNRTIARCLIAEPSLSVRPQNTSQSLESIRKWTTKSKFVLIKITKSKPWIRSNLLMGKNWKKNVVNL